MVEIVKKNFQIFPYLRILQCCDVTHISDDKYEYTRW